MNDEPQKAQKTTGPYPLIPFHIMGTGKLYHRRPNKLIRLFAGEGTWVRRKQRLLPECPDTISAIHSFILASSPYLCNFIEGQAAR